MSIGKICNIKQNAIIVTNIQTLAQTILPTTNNVIQILIHAIINDKCNNLVVCVKQSTTRIILKSKANFFRVEAVSQLSLHVQIRKMTSSI